MGRKRQFKDNSRLQMKYQYDRGTRKTRRNASTIGWSFEPKRSKVIAEDMKLDRKKSNEMNNDYIKFQKEHGLRRKPRINKSAPVDPFKGKSKHKRNQMLRSKWQAMYQKKRRNTVAKLLAGKSLFDETSLPKDSAEFWRNIYKEPKGTEIDPSEHLASLEFIPKEEYEWMNKPIDKIDVKEQIKATANGTTPGIDGLNKEGIDNMEVKTLVQWYNRFLNEGIMPKPLKRFNMVLIPKKEKAIHPKDFRPLSISSIIRRVFSGILNGRIAEIKTDDAQRGFKPGIEGCVINLRILAEIVKKATKELRDMSIAWIDLRKAFDSFNHLKLIEVLNSSGIPRKITRMITNMYRGNTSYLKTGERIPIEKGVLQGDPMSPTLFNLVLNEALRNFTGGVQYGQRNLPYLAFADDLVILANDPKELQEQLNHLNRRLTTFGLEINPDKCKCAHIQVNRKIKTYCVAVKPRIVINNNNTELKF